MSELVNPIIFCNEWFLKKFKAESIQGNEVALGVLVRRLVFSKDFKRLGEMFNNIVQSAYLRDGVHFSPFSLVDLMLADDNSNYLFVAKYAGVVDEDGVSRFVHFNVFFTPLFDDGRCSHYCLCLHKLFFRKRRVVWQSEGIPRIIDVKYYIDK